MIRGLVGTALTMVVIILMNLKNRTTLSILNHIFGLGMVIFISYKIPDFI